MGGGREAGARSGARPAGARPRRPYSHHTWNCSTLDTFDQKYSFHFSRRSSLLPPDAVPFKGINLP
jgi:hypothetical protein